MDLKVTRTPEGCLSVEVASDTMPKLPRQFYMNEIISWPFKLPDHPNLAIITGTSIEHYYEDGSRFQIVWWRRIYAVRVVDVMDLTMTELDLLRIKPKPPTLELMKWISEPVTTTTRFTLFSRQ